MFSGYNLIEFQECFNSNQICLEHLSALKWRHGFVCQRCSNTSSSRVKDTLNRKCNRCKHIHSPTSGTLFHRCKIPLTKAFLMVFLVVTEKKGVSSCSLSRRLSIRQKTCYLFKRKVSAALVQGDIELDEGKIDVDDSYLGGYEKGKQGRSRGKKKLFLLAIEKKGNGISRIAAKTVHSMAKNEVEPFFEKHIPTTAKVRTDKHKTYTSIKGYPEMEQEESIPGKNFRLLHRQIQQIKSTIRGIQHSVRHLQPYLDEICFRFNNRLNDNIFTLAIENMVKNPPIYAQYINSYWGN